MNELERYQRAVGAAQAALRDVQNMAPTGVLTHLAQEALSYINSLIHPPTVYEDVEIEGWGVFKVGTNDPRGLFSDEEDASQAALAYGPGHYIAYLSGTRKVEKPQPRKRSVSVDCRINSCGDTAGIKTSNPFKDYPETHGKRGVLTFTWQE